MPGLAIAMVLLAASPLDLLPAEALGWRGDGADESVDRDGLFSLIDGGAEAYRALNVRRVGARRYVKAGAPDVVVDVFDMGSSADAYGAYLGTVLRVLTMRLDDLGEQAGGALPTPVGLILEEFPALGRLGSLVRTPRIRLRLREVLKTGQQLRGLRAAPQLVERKQHVKVFAVPTVAVARKAPHAANPVAPSPASHRSLLRIPR